VPARPSRQGIRGSPACRHQTKCVRGRGSGLASAMGIRFYCPNGHKLHVKAFQAGLRGICPYCGTPVDIPLQSTRPSSKEERLARRRRAAGRATADKPVPILQKPESGGGGAGRGAEIGPVPSGGQPASMAAGTAGGPSPMPQPAAEATIPRGAVFAEGRWGQIAGGGANAAMSAGASFPAGAQPGAPPLATPRSHNLSVLDEAPNAVWYVRPSAGGQYGPATADVMRAWLAEGRIAYDTLVWREGWRDWREAGEVFPQLACSPDDALPSLRSIIEEEVYALGPKATSPGQAAEQASAHSHSALVMLLLAGLVLLAAAIIGLWIWFDTGS